MCLKDPILCLFLPYTTGPTPFVILSFIAQVRAVYDGSLFYVMERKWSDGEMVRPPWCSQGVFACGRERGGTMTIHNVYVREGMDHDHTQCR